MMEWLGNLYEGGAQDGNEIFYGDLDEKATATAVDMDGVEL